MMVRCIHGDAVTMVALDMGIAVMSPHQSTRRLFPGYGGTGVRGYGGTGVRGYGGISTGVLGY